MMIRFYLPALFLLVALTNLAKAQTITPPTTPHEQYGGYYQNIPAHTRNTSPAFQYKSPGIIVKQVNVDSLGKNILNDAGNEPSIAVDPLNPNRIMIGWRQFDDISNSFRQAGYGYTTNGGESWLASVIDPGVFRSDPVLDVDNEGKFYYNSLTVDSTFQDFSCQVYKFQDNDTWDSGTQAQGGDKQWMAIDRSGGVGNGHIYAYWSQNFTICVPNHATRSTNGGASYEDCVSTEPSVFWGAMNVGPDGTVYAAGAGGNLSKSTNAQNAAETMHWTSCGTELGSPVSFNGESPNPGGLLGQVWVATDHSGGSTHGNVYLLASASPLNSIDQLDVVFARSSDGGTTWSTPITLNTDGIGNWQWFGTMSVAPNGRIDVIWLDTRDNPGTYLSSLYYTFSVDGGENWITEVRLSGAFDPHLGWPQQQKMGDYFHMVSHNDYAHLAWSGTFNGEQDVYYGRIDPGLVHTSDYNHADLFQMQISPNPAQAKADIHYTLPEQGIVNVKIYNALQQLVHTSPRMDQTAGNHLFTWQTDLFANGMYYCVLEIDGVMVGQKRVVVVKN